LLTSRIQMAHSIGKRNVFRPVPWQLPIAEIGAATLVPPIARHRFSAIDGLRLYLVLKDQAPLAVRGKRSGVGCESRVREKEERYGKSQKRSYSVRVHRGTPECA